MRYLSRKGILGLVLISTLGLVGCFHESGKMIESENNQEPSVSILDKDEVDLIDSLEKFVSLIKFKDGSVLSETDIESVYFTRGNGKHESVSSMKIKDFYNANVGAEPILREVVTMFGDMYRLDQIEEVAFENLPESLQMHSDIIRPITPDGENLLAINKDLLADKFKEGTATAEEVKQLSYIYNLQGLYDISDKLDKANCELNKERCLRVVSVRVKGNVKDSVGMPLTNAVITVLNYPSDKQYRSDINGEFDFELKTKDLEKIRMKVQKEGYSEAFNDFYVVTEGPFQERERFFVLTKAHASAQFDLTKKVAIKTTTQKPFGHSLMANSFDESSSDYSGESLEEFGEDPENEYEEEEALVDDDKGRGKDNKKKRNNVRSLEKTINTKNRKIRNLDAKYKNGHYILNTGITRYEIPENAIVTEDGEVYLGKVTVYVYEFDKSSNVDSLLRVDAANELRSYIGNIFKTFGMPFIQFYSSDGKELFVARENPMKIKTRLTEMEALRAGSDGVYGPLTDADLDKLITESNNGASRYPISRRFLIDNDLLRFPTWWVLDRKRGIWDAIPMKVLDKDGGLETIFYSVVLDPAQFGLDNKSLFTR